MLFVCDIGNTNISLGVFDGDTLVFHSKIATSVEKSVDEYAILISGVFAMYRVSVSLIDGAAVSSVVRPLNTRISQAIVRLMQVKPILLGPGVKTGLNIKTDMPSQMGADIVANAVAASELSSIASAELSSIASADRLPVVIVALGTATTLTAINKSGELCGVLICPGVLTSLSALSEKASELPYISLEKPRALLGKNTLDSMLSAVIYGNASMIDGLLDRISAEWDNVHLNVIATGSLAEAILPYCTKGRQILYEPNLTLLGLKKIYQINSCHKP